jgi:hypothetical protein
MPSSFDHLIVIICSFAHLYCSSFTLCNDLHLDNWWWEIGGGGGGDGDGSGSGK